MSQIRLDISDTVQFPVKFEVSNANGTPRTFSFTLTATRMSQTELESAGDTKALPILLERVTDWSGQRLVLGPDDQPAPFSREGLEAVLTGIVNTPRVFLAAYVEACGAKPKN